MRVLIVGSGGREHALAAAIARSPRLTGLFAAPGNPGIAALAECWPIAVSDLDGLVKAALRERIDLVVVGPEAPLVAGLADRLAAAGIACFGPGAAAAQLEGSKAFTKALCDRHGIPTAAYQRVSDVAAARAAVRRLGAPIVVKADGLAAGRGVVVAETINEALAAVDEMMVAQRFGDAGASLVLEEKLIGEEASFFAVSDGKTILPLAAAQDHKAVGEGDTGPNTGGMGAYSPTPTVTPAMERRILDEIVRPALDGLAAEGMPFRGVLFAGVMITATGPKLIEFNVRFGDPECEVLCRRLRSDLLDLLAATSGGTLDQITLDWDPRPALAVVMAAKGYPGEPERGTVIRGLDDALAAAPEVAIFHAGTKQIGADLVADGGRVLVVTALGETVAEAQARAYAAIDRIDWPGGFCRRDIGWRAVTRPSPTPQRSPAP